jgi:hypothetical protein
MGEDAGAKASRWLVWIAFTLVAVCLFYLLSVGPVMAIMEWTGANSEHARGQCDCVYHKPLMNLHDNCDVLRGPIEDYIAWWDGLWTSP